MPLRLGPARQPGVVDSEREPQVVRASQVGVWRSRRAAISSAQFLMMIAASGTRSSLLANPAIGDALAQFFASTTESPLVIPIVIDVFFPVWGLGLEPPTS